MSRAPLIAAFLLALAIPLAAHDSGAERYLKGLQAWQAKDAVAAKGWLMGLPQDTKMPDEPRLYAGLILSKLALEGGDTLAARTAILSVKGLEDHVQPKAKVDFLLHYSYVMRNVAPQDFPGSEAAADEALKLEPASKEAQLNQARSRLKTGWYAHNHHDALAQAEALRRTEEALGRLDAAGDKQLLSDIQNMLGQCNYIRRDLEKAITQFKASQDLLPRRSNLRNIGWSYLLLAEKRANCAEKLDLYQEALQWFEQAVAAHDSNKATDGALLGLRPEVERLRKQCHKKAEHAFP